MDYKLKLRQFNSTEKYRDELKQLYTLINPKKWEKILDYGCGLGTAMRFLREKTDNEIYGFDITKSLYEWDEFYFRSELYFKVDCIYFLHSFSHIPEADKILYKVVNNFLSSGGHIVIVSPNPEWLALKQNPNYKPDATVIRHYTMLELIDVVTDCGLNIISFGEFGEEINGVGERIFIKAKN